MLEFWVTLFVQLPNHTAENGMQVPAQLIFKDYAFLFNTWSGGKAQHLFHPQWSGAAHK